MSKDRPWLKLYPAVIQADTASLTDAEFGRHVRQALQAWVFGDSSKMPTWMVIAKNEADIKSEKYRKNRLGSTNNDCGTIDNDCGTNSKDCVQLPISSLLSSSLGESMREGEEIDLLKELAEVCQKWSAQVGVIANGIRMARNAGYSIDAQKIVAGAKAYISSKKGEDEKFIMDVDNWLKGGQWLKHQTQTTKATKSGLEHSSKKRYTSSEIKSMSQHDRDDVGIYLAEDGKLHPAMDIEFFKVAT